LKRASKATSISRNVPKGISSDPSLLKPFWTGRAAQFRKISSVQFDWPSFYVLIHYSLFNILRKKEVDKANGL
jgi:hypothetical protein